MAAIGSVLYALFFYTGSVLYVLSGIVVLPLGEKPVQSVANGWAWWNRVCARIFLRIRTRVEGEVPSGAVLVASKHQSMFETTELVVILDTPSVVMKRELAQIPLWGRVAQAYGMISVDRDGGAKALRELVAKGAKIRAQGRPVAIFPEGTRVAPGEAPPLEAGFAGLYRALAMPVVPLALDSGRVWPRRSFVKRPGIITFRFGETIPPGLPRAEIEARVHAAINALETNAPETPAS
jgi:1-acyl-sn-glycerol-3-phosphate acyltransferase